MTLIYVAKSHIGHFKMYI